MASRRYRGRNSLNGNVTHSNARLSSIEKRSIPTTISAGAIDGALLAESSVTSINLAPGSVQGENIATGAVNTGNLADASVTSAKLAPDALAGIEVGESSVDTAQLVDDAVTRIKIRDAAVNNAKISDVSGSKINAGTVAATYIADLDAGKITSGTFNINRIPDVSSKVSDISGDVVNGGNIVVDTIIASNRGSSIGEIYYRQNGGDSQDEAYIGSRLWVNSSNNLSGNTTAENVQRASGLYVGTTVNGIGIDQNQINTTNNTNLYLNGSGSTGAVIISEGGGQTSVPNGFNNIFAATNASGGTTRVAVFTNTTNGRYGTNSSTRKVKQDIVPAALDVDAILSIEAKNYRYIEAVEIEGDLAKVEVGFIAEDLVEAGLSEYCFYDGNGELLGIHYELLTTALHAVVKDQSNKISNLTSTIQTMEARLEALEAKVE